MKWINKLSLNAKKTKFMIFDNLDQLDTINITINEDYTFTIKEQKILGSSIRKSALGVGSDPQRCLWVMNHADIWQVLIFCSFKSTWLFISISINPIWMHSASHAMPSSNLYLLQDLGITLATFLNQLTHSGTPPKLMFGW